MSPPAFQLYARDFLADPLVDAMEPEELGGYFRLLLIAWQQSDRGYIPNDAARLASWSRLGRRWKKHAPAILACFRIAEDGRLFQKRMVEVSRELDEYKERQRAKGLASANARKDSKQVQPRLVSGCVPVATERQPEGNSASASALSYLSPARACVKAELASRGVLTPDAVSLGEAAQRVAEYAETSGGKPEAVAPEAFKAFDKLAATWPVRRITPALFCKHWDAIQQVMAGHDPTPRQNPRAPPEAPQRRYEDMGDVARRIGGGD